MVTKFGKKINLSHEEFAKRFENQTLKPNMFDHYGHLRLAWFYLQNHNLQEATSKISDSIRNYAEHWGQTDKFREDLTILVMKILNDRLLSQKHLTFDSFLENNPELLTDMKTVISKYHLS